MKDCFNCPEKCGGEEQYLTGKLRVVLETPVGELKLGEYTLMHPKLVRDEVENMLLTDRDFSVVNKLDLSAFSQKRQDQYWNCVFWFQQLGLPVDWLAPYGAHLNDIGRKVSVNKKDFTLVSRFKYMILSSFEAYQKRKMGESDLDEMSAMSLRDDSLFDEEMKFAGSKIEDEPELAMQVNATP